MLNEEETINVEHNVNLQGLAATHQIDVYWELKKGDITYRTIVQAKDYNSRVTQDKLFTFHTVLNDLPGQPRGIFITKSGYQKGAKEFAEKHGILLYEFRTPIEADWTGKIKDININLTINVPDVSNFQLDIDTEWIKRLREKNNIHKQKNFQIPSDKLVLYNDDDSPIMSVHQLRSELISKASLSSDQKIIHEFHLPTFIHVDDPDLPKIKLSKISFNLSFHTLNDSINIESEKFVKFVLKNISSNTSNFVDNDFKRL